MKRIAIVALILLSAPAVLMADGKKKTSGPAKAKTTEVKPTAPDNKEIHWITSIDELQAKMQQNPKKVYVDIYTGWCGWCKKMDVSTFSNPDLIKYMNLNFYAVKFDAERQDVIHFQGKEFRFEPQFRANTWAVELMKGNNPNVQMSYPTTIFMLENFQNPTPVPGYMTVPQIEVILTYFGDNAYKHVKWEDYQKSYKPIWKTVSDDMTPPPGVH
jgi:thioredoxin-related protein